MKTLISIYSLALAGWICAQNNTPQNKRLSVESFELSNSIYWLNNNQMSYQDISRLALENNFESYDFTGYQFASSCCGVGYESVNLNLNLSLKNKAGEFYKGNPLIRLGVSYNRGFTNSVSFSKMESFTIDSVSVTYQGNTNSYAVDSVYLNSHSFGTSSERINLNASVIWRTDFNKRWWFYAGAGLGFGIGFNSKIEHNESQISNIAFPFTIFSSQFGDLYSNNNYSSNFEIESFRTPSLFNFFVSAPFGVNFRIGKKENYWKHVNLFAEFSPNIWITSYSDVLTMINAGMSATIGVRISL